MEGSTLSLAFSQRQPVSDIGLFGYDVYIHVLIVPVTELVNIIVDVCDDFGEDHSGIISERSYLRKLNPQIICKLHSISTTLYTVQYH